MADNPQLTSLDLSGIGTLPTEVPAVTNSTIPTPSLYDGSVNFDPLTVAWWTFNNTLEETYAGADFSPTNGEQDRYRGFAQFDLLSGSIVNKSGLLFKSGESFSAEVGSIGSTGIYSLNLSFNYFSPKVLGFIRNAITKRLTPKIAPIIGKANIHEISGQKLVIHGQGEWIISEIGYSNTHNAIQLSLCHNGSGPTAIFVSEPYKPGFHNVYINVKTDTTASLSPFAQIYIRIDIDGGYGEQHIRIDRSLLLVNTIAPIVLNGINFGYTAHHTFQDGAYISNLILQRKSSVFHTKTLLMTRFGPEIALTSDTEFPGFSFLGIGFDQPTTVSTNQIFTDGGSILLARSNGDLLKGHRPIWDMEFAYISPQSIQDLDNGSSGNPPEWTEIGIRIRGGTIRV